MLFHVTAKHSYETCPAIQHGFDSDEAVVSQRGRRKREGIGSLGLSGFTHSICRVRSN